MVATKTGNRTVRKFIEDLQAEMGSALDLSRLQAVSDITLKLGTPLTPARQVELRDLCLERYTARMPEPSADTPPAVESEPSEGESSESAGDQGLEEDLLGKLQMLQDLADTLQPQVISSDWRPTDVRLDEDTGRYLFTDPWGNPRQFTVATYLKCINGQDTFAFLKGAHKTARRQLTEDEFRQFVDWTRFVIEELQADCQVHGQPITDPVPAESIANQVINGKRVLPHTTQAQALSKKKRDQVITPARACHMCRFIEPVIGQVALEADFNLEKVDVQTLVARVQEVTDQVNASIDEKNEKMGAQKADRHLPHVEPLEVLERFKVAWAHLTNTEEKGA